MKKKRGWIIASFALLIASLLCACGKHEADGTWQFDETYHWQNCEKSDGHTYEKSAHEYAANGANKKCAVCGKEVDYTEEENALYWIEGRDGTIGYAGIYTIDFTEETIGKDGEKKRHARIVGNERQIFLYARSVRCGCGGGICIRRRKNVCAEIRPRRRREANEIFSVGN